MIGRLDSIFLGSIQLSGELGLALVSVSLYKRSSLMATMLRWIDLTSTPVLGSRVVEVLAVEGFNALVHRSKRTEIQRSICQLLSRQLSLAAVRFLCECFDD